MSAILGEVDFSGRPVLPGRFRAALAALGRHGGHAALRIDGPCAFGQRQGRPADRPDSGDGGPAALPRAGPLSLVADAVLDNAERLRAALPGAETGPGAGVGAAGADSTLLLHCFRAWGTQTPERLRGDFAFAAYDSDARRLVLVRDHIGTRPLYVARRGTRVLFATDLRGLLALDAGWQVDPAMLARFLADPSKPLGGTFAAGVRRVSPGGFEIVTPDGETARRWWDPHALPELRLPDANAYVEAYRDHLDRAVARCVGPATQDMAIGAHFSGGVDSTTVAALAAPTLSGQGRALRGLYAWSPAISEAFPDLGALDERHRIEAVAARIGLPCSYGTARGAVVRAFMDRRFELEGALDLDDEIQLLARAQADGIDLLLSGWGGDEAATAHGYGSVAENLRRGRLTAALRHAARWGGSRREPRKLLGSLLSWGVMPLLPDGLYRRMAPYDDPFAGGCFPGPALDPHRAAARAWRRDDTRLTGDVRGYMRDLVLRGHIAARAEVWAIWGAEHGIRYRYPLLDRDLMEFVLRVPGDIHTHDTYGRYLVRRAMAGRLPVVLHKLEGANDIVRNEGMGACWRQLAAEARAGRFDGAGGWVDRPALRAALLAAPEGNSYEEVRGFARIQPAVQAVFLEERARAGLGAGLGAESAPEGSGLA